MAGRTPIHDAPHPSTPAPSPALEAYFATRPWLLALILLIVTFVAYQPAWHAGFIWDDDDHLTANPVMTTPHGLRMIWSSIIYSRYYPLTLTTFWFEHRLWRLEPMPYHLVNIGLHAINGILIVLVLRRLRVPAPWLAAFLWVLHPVNVESVAWITEMKNTQSAFFFFLSLLCFLEFDAREKGYAYVLAFLCATAAMLSKPSTVVLPAVLLLCAWWLRRRWQLVDIVRTIPFAVLSWWISTRTVVEQRMAVSAAGTPEWKLSAPERFVIAGKAVWFYAWKLLWPAPLTFVYPHWKVDAGSFLGWLPLVALVAGAALLWARRQQPWARAGLFGGGFFVVALLPVLGFIDVYYFRFSYVADHFQYLASIGLISFAASTGATICRRTGQWGRDGGTVAATIVLLILGVLTWRQARIYHDLNTLWGDTLSKDPQCWMAHNNLGTALLHEGNVTDAVAHFEQALQIKPDYAAPHCGLGIALARMGKTEEAIAQYEQALRIRPDYAEAHCGLAIALARTGKTEDAITHYQRALWINPNYVVARYNLGLVLAQTGRTREAIAQFQQVLWIRPDFAEARNELARLQAGQE